MSKNYVGRATEVELGGKVRKLRFDFNGVADLEDHYGKPIGRIMSEESMGFSTIRAMYWAGLKWNDQGITVQRVGTMLMKKLEQGTELEDLAQTVMKALLQSGVLGNKARETAEELEEEEALMAEEEETKN